MTSELLLLRHAKSDWKSDARTDQDRPLNKRGLSAAPRMGRFMLHEGLLPDHILCSTARRTRETLAALQSTWGLASPTLDAIEFCDAIYEATLRTLIETINTRLNESTRLMVIGHNPGMQMLMHFLVEDSDHPLFARNYPTCALAHIAIPPNKKLNGGCGKLLRLEHVKKLPTL